MCVLPVRIMKRKISCSVHHHESFCVHWLQI
ncbi:unnamed protein product, partial [Rotaria magnacalcarata]